MVRIPALYGGHLQSKAPFESDLYRVIVMQHVGTRRTGIIIKWVFIEHDTTKELCFKSLGDHFQKRQTWSTSDRHRSQHRRTLKQTLACTSDQRNYAAWADAGLTQASEKGHLLLAVLCGPSSIPIRPEKETEGVTELYKEQQVT